MFPLPSTTSLSALSTLPTSSTDPEPTAEEPPLGLPTQITTNGQLKKVKVYELRNDAWFDRGTGHVHGLYDEGTDQALLVVTAEEVLDKSVKARIEKEKEEARLAKKEESSEQEAEPGGFVLDEEDAEKDEEGSWGDPKALKALRAKGIEGRLIMHTFIQGRDAYSRQQDTLICWTETDGTDIAMSFADPDDCESVWEFIQDVVKMLDSSMDQEDIFNNPPSDDISFAFGSMSPVGAGMGQGRGSFKTNLIKPTMGHLKEAFDQVKLLSKNAQGRDTIVEAVIKEDYLKTMIQTFEQAEDLETLDDLHMLFTLMQTILYINDTSVIELILEEDVFSGVVGLLEYDPEFPTLKASYRDFLTATSKFREPVSIKDEGIHVKIHQTYRLLFLKDVVLARSLEDSTFNMLNSFIFFNQNDIVQHMQSNDALLEEVFRPFIGKTKAKAGAGSSERKVMEFRSEGDEIVPALEPSPAGSPVSPETTEIRTHKREIVLLLHQLLLMSKNIPLPARTQLVRTLLERGLVPVLEWAFSYGSTLSTSTCSPDLPAHPPPTTPTPETLPADPVEDLNLIPNAAIEMLTHCLDHDPSSVRNIILREVDKLDAGELSTTLVLEIIKLLLATDGMKTPKGGLRSQLADGLRQLLDTGESDTGSAASRGPVKDGPVAESFLTYFYENCVESLMKPLACLPDFKTLQGSFLPLTSEETPLLLHLCDLLSFMVETHGHRSQYFILSGTMNLKVGCLLSARDKPLRHASVRFFRACLKVHTHFMYRYLNKGDVFAPVLELAASESFRDNVLSSACLELFEYIRKENIKVILDHLMDHHGERIRLLSSKRVLKGCFEGLIQKWEANNEPPPVPADVRVVQEDSKRRNDREEEDYFQESDEETNASSTSNNAHSLPSSPSSRSLSSLVPKRKRQRIQIVDPRPSIVFTPASSSGPSSSVGKGLDLGYGDEDSDDEPVSDPSPSTAAASSSSPSSSSSAPPPIGPKLDSPDKIEGITQRMSEKRRREEEEDEEDGLGGLLGNAASSKGHKRGGGISSFKGDISMDALNKVGGEKDSPARSPTGAGPASKDDSKASTKMRFSLKSFKFGGGNGGGGGGGK